MKCWNVLEHGAIPDGRTKNTAAIANAIEACASAGGGRVLFPPGQYLTGPIHLRSNIDLHVERGATILFSRDYEDYPLVHTNYEGEEAVRAISPLWGQELTNISITGDGTFDGQGEAWRPVKKFKMTEKEWKQLVASGGVVDEEYGIWWPTKAAMEGRELVQALRQKNGPVNLEDYLPARDYLRPNMVKLTNCRQVLLDGPTFRNSAAWNVHLLMCEQVTVRNVTIINPWYAANGDALDIESCRNVTVSDSHFDCGDDGICIKSGRDEAGRRRGRPSENIAITNCVILRAHGGVTIGSEMSGGVRNIAVTNCIFDGTDIGIRFKTTRGRGGVVDNIEMSNIAMRNIRHEAISLNMYYFVRDPQPEPVSERTPCFRGISLRNITCQGAGRAIEIRGLPEMPIERIVLQNIDISARRGALIADARDVRLEGVRLAVEESPVLECHNVSNLCTSDLGGSCPVEQVSDCGNL